MRSKSASLTGRSTSRPVAIRISGGVVARRIVVIRPGQSRAPCLEARPVAPLEDEALDRQGAARWRTHHAGLAELEAAFLDHPAGSLVTGAIGAPQYQHPAIGEDMVDQRLGR